VKLIAHLIGKDLRAGAVVALIWIVLMSLEVALQLSGVAARPREPGRPSLLYLLQLFLPFAEVAAAALIVSLVIHEDPLVDTHAFWLTRPIPRGQLFLAKLIAIALIVFAPALTALVVLLAWYHVPPVYIMRAGFEVTLWLAFPLLLLTAAATLTSTLSRFVMLLVGAIVAGVAVIGITETLRPPVLVFEPRPPRFIDPAQGVTVTAFLIAGFVATIHQFYRRRDWRVAVVGIVLTIGAGTQIARFWPGLTFFEPLGEATGAWTDPAIARLRLLDARQQVSAYHPRDLYTVSVPLVLDGLPDGYTAAPFTMQGRLTRADGTVLTSGRAMPMQVAAKGDYQPSLTLPYGDDPIGAGPTSWEAWPVLLQLGEGHRAAVSPGGALGGAAFDAVGKAGAAAGAADGDPPFYKGRYNGTFHYRIAHHEQVASLRLDRLGTYTDGPRGITIVEARDLDTECRVTLEVTNTELTLAGPREPAAGYYFTDRRTGARLRAARAATWSGMLGPLRVGLSPGHRIFTAGYVRWNVVNLRDDGEDGKGTACEDTNLIFVRTVAAGSLTRSIELPDFQVQPAQDSFFRR
jgi:hypothetical protein